MPKIDIDYSNTIIYKITCKDTAITDVYVGHTTNFVQRKHGHKRNCINPTSVNYKLKLYKVIRENGGWDNWKMEIITFFECKDHYHARKKEQEYFISLNATLNSIEPLPKPKVIVPLVKIEASAVKTKTYNSSLKFKCDLCKTETDNKKDFNKHLLTKKHLKKENPAQYEDTSKEQPPILTCSKCTKSYETRSGLWKHQKNGCVIKNESNAVIIPEPQHTSSNENTLLTNLVLEVVKSNNELQKQHSELQKQHTDLQKQVIDLLCKNNNSTVL
jgi:hypothetical protein